MQKLEVTGLVVGIEHDIIAITMMRKENNFVKVV